MTLLERKRAAGQPQSTSSSGRVAYTLSEAGATTGDGLRSFSSDSTSMLGTSYMQNQA